MMAANGDDDSDDGEEDEEDMKNVKLPRHSQKTRHQKQRARGRHTRALSG